MQLGSAVRLANRIHLPVLLLVGPVPVIILLIRETIMKKNEPATYNNAPFLGVLARLHGGRGKYSQLLIEDVPLPIITTQQPPKVTTPPGFSVRRPAIF